LGIIIRGFGTGGIQTRMPFLHADGIARNHKNATLLWKMLRRIAQEIPVVMTTQCARGGVTEDYEYANMLKEAGILLSGFFNEDFLDAYMTVLAIASLTQTDEERERGHWMKNELKRFFCNNVISGTFPQTPTPS
jgi:L-asparaginase/Glu-tRNA(Gln) amidotransferase subunit D